MIDSLLDLKVFEKVVSLGSMSAAARDLGQSLAGISKRLALLEQRLGVRLMQRTTRRQSLTPEGEAFYERSLRILAEVAEAEEMMAGSRDRISGVLSITAPRSFGRQYIAPIVADFQALHPQLSIRLALADEATGVVEGGIDVAFRFGALPDSSMSARYIAPNYSVMCAAPAYLARRGTPVHLNDLATRHTCIVCGARPSAPWLLQLNGAPHVAKVRGTFIVNDGETAQALALEGAGITFKSVWDLGPHIAAGRLVPVMKEFTAPTEPLHAVMPHSRQLAPRVRHFVDFAVARLRAEWKWDACAPSDRQAAISAAATPLAAPSKRVKSARSAGVAD